MPIQPLARFALVYLAKRDRVEPVITSDNYRAGRRQTRLLHSPVS